MRRLTAMVLVLVLWPAASAGAEPRAVLSSGDQVLYADRSGRDFVCLGLALGGSACRPLPRSPYQPVLLRAPGWQAGAVVGEVAAVELETAAGPVRLATEAAGWTRLRFFLVRAQARARIVRAYDAAGRLIGAADPTPSGPPGPRRELLRGPGVRVTAAAGARLAPSPLQPDRQVPEVCVRPRSFDVCATSDEAPAVFDVTGSAGCAPALGTVVGLTQPAVRRVEVVFGDGARRRYATRDVGGIFRVVALLVPRGHAVRSVVALDAAGRRLGRQDVGVGPSGRRCARPGSWTLYAVLHVLGRVLRPEPAPPQVALTAGGARLLAADAGDGLCTGIGRIAGSACLVPPVDGIRSSLDRRGRVVGGVLAATVASVTLRLRGGGRQDVETSAGPGYTGKYAGVVRFVLARIPAGREVRDVVARDAAGRRLGSGGVFGPVRPPRRAVLLRAPGYAIEREDEGPGACLVARTGGERQRAPLCGFDRGTALAAVSCRPRRTVVYGRGRRPVTVELAGGRRVATVARGGVWAARIPRRSGVAAVHLGGRRVVLPLPPATEQCGYGATTQAFP